MDFPVELIFVVIFALVSFLNWLFKESGLMEKLTGKERQPPPAQPEEEYFGPEDDDDLTSAPQRSSQGENAEEERVRKFMEALGIPTEQPPPPVVEPRKQPTPPPVPKTYYPTEEETAPIPEIKPILPEAKGKTPQEMFAENRPSKPVLSKAEKEALARVEKESHVWDITKRRKPRSRKVVGSVTPKNLLRSREGVRSAFILKELLDTPPGLQSVPGTTNLHTS